MKSPTYLFPSGKSKAVTLSYDDGVVDDRRLIFTLNRHGIKASFHINSGIFGVGNRVESSEIAELYEGHEVSAHSVHHPHLDMLPVLEQATEILEDRRALEDLVGYPVRGMSYPFGSYTPEISARLRAYGIEYTRTTKSHGGFHLPEDFMEWHPTCHHNTNSLRRPMRF